ncbi:MAG TPA: DUF4465 domain-containing protein [Pirellulales bacterium]|nr:DUF4465 domain-containing protein [Pirellulales bacterium]
MLSKRVTNACAYSAVLLAISVGGSAKSEVIDFNDVSVTKPSYRPDGTTVTGYYFNGPAANAQPGMDPYGDPTQDGTIPSGSPAIELSNSYVPSFDSWSGFAVSNVNDTTDPGYTNQFAAITGVGAGPGVGGNPDNYAVDFGYVDQLNPRDPTQLAMLPNIQIPAGYKIDNFDVTNTTYAALSMEYGDQFAKKFGPGDFFELSVYGTNASGQLLPDSVNFYLANFLNGSSYIIQNWTSVDLSALSGASTLYFNLSSSDVGVFGMNTPGYFALDNVQISRVPEPSTCMLLGIGAVSFVAVQRRHKQYRRSPV